MGTGTKQSSHHHRPDRAGPKPFKGKSKGRVKKLLKGRVEDGAARPAVLAVGAGKSRVKVSKRAHLPGSCPRLIALLACHPEADLRSARNQLLIAAGAHPDQLLVPTPVTVNGFTFAEASSDVFSFLDLAKVADIVVPVVCPRSGPDSSAGFGVDERSEQLLTMLKAQGLPSCLVLTQGLDVKSSSSSSTLKKTCMRYMYTLLPDKPRIVAVEKSLDAIRYLRSLALKSIGWRDLRPSMLSDSIQVAAAADGTSTVAVSGFVRGPNQIWSPDRLVHVTGYGDFQLERIVTADGEEFVADAMARQSLDGLCALDPLANEQSLITEQELQECEAEARLRRQAERKERLMSESGLTDIQATWESACISDSDDDDDHGMNIDAEAKPVENEGADHVAMALKFRMERDELEFPDEVDCPVDQDAKVRFQKYRGLQNFVSSSWDVMEDLPVEYGHIFRFENYTATRKRALLLSTEGDGASSGTYCRLVLIGVPMAMAEEWVQHRSFLVLSSLHHYERQVSVSHYKVRRSSSVAEPISSKSSVVIAAGFRRFPALPLLSQDTPNCDKHRVERFLQPNRYSIASCYSRIDFSHASTLVFEGDQMIASGSHISVDPNRLLIKRIVLTGYPIRVHKRRAVVRYMFFRPSDIRWFKPVGLTTKSGLIGQIDEPLGTHGYMKCSFNGMLKYNDTICMNLYKRQYPPFNIEQFQSSL